METFIINIHSYLWCVSITRNNFSERNEGVNGKNYDINYSDEFYDLKNPPIRKNCIR